MEQFPPPVRYDAESSDSNSNNSMDDRERGNDPQHEQDQYLYQRQHGDEGEDWEEESIYSDAEEFGFSDDEEHEDDEEEEEDVGRRVDELEMQDNIEAEREIRNNRPVYYGATITVFESMMVILMILIHHNVTYLCLADIITAINLHCLQENLVKNSLFIFQKFFSIEETEIIKHFYCTTCVRPLNAANAVCPSCPRRKNSYFVELPFQNQLKEMFKRDNFYNNLQWRFERPPNPPGVITDMYDGSLYRTWMTNGFLNNPNNISFSWYTDGVPVFKSSHVSFWPLYLTINELPFDVRLEKENTILAGIWFGDKKPSANYFMDKFYQQFEDIFQQGIEITLPNPNREIVVRGVLLRGTCDLPAKCQFLNFTQYNGAHGCPACFLEGVNIPTDAGGSVHAFPFSENFEVRTSEECERLGDIATLNNPIRGVKGPTTFSRFMPDFMQGMGIDKMHGIEGGVVKKILVLLFHKDYQDLPFSLYHFKDLVNERLTAIKPPKFVHRMPRSIDDLIHWKASELKAFFFFYSIPVFEGILRPNYFEHYLLLVTAISLLNADKINQQMIDIAQDLLYKFVRQFETLYGLVYCSINIHQLLHLPQCVRVLGPLWSFSCFAYENLNGLFLQLVHGTWHIDTQIAKSHFQFVKMARLFDRLQDGSVKDFCMRKKRQVKIIEQIIPHCHSVGSYKRINLLPGIIVRALENSGFEIEGPTWQYLRLLKDGQLYVAETYLRESSTRSCYVKYLDNDDIKFGVIHSFIKMDIHCRCRHDPCDCERNHLAIVKEIATEGEFMAEGDIYRQGTMKFLRKCYVSDVVCAINVSNLVSVCVGMNIRNQLYIGIPVNSKELE